MEYERTTNKGSSGVAKAAMAVGGAALGLTVLGKGGILNNGALGNLGGGDGVADVAMLSTLSNNYVSAKEMTLIREIGAQGSTIAKLEAEKYADYAVEAKYAPLEKRVCALETAAAVNVQADSDWRKYVNAEFIHQPKAYINESIVVCQQCGCRNGSCGCGGHGHRDDWGCNGGHQGHC